jgi:hypothetical protein
MLDTLANIMTLLLPKDIVRVIVPICAITIIHVHHSRRLIRIIGENLAFPHREQGLFESVTRQLQEERVQLKDTTDLVERAFHGSLMRRAVSHTHGPGSYRGVASCHTFLMLCMV